MVPTLKQSVLKSHLKWYLTRVSNEWSNRRALNSIIGATVASKIQEKMETGNPSLSN